MKTQVFCMAILAALFTGTVSAYEITANAGVVSEYVFRGLPQTDGNAAAQGGFDISEGDFNLGAWASTVKGGDSIDNSGPNPILVSGDNGLELDFYAAYSNSFGEIDYSVGATYYTYTDNFDDDYIELNLSGAWKWLSIDAAVGEYKNFAGPTLEYSFVSLTGEYQGFYTTVGDFSEDFEGTYYEVGYGNTLNAGGDDLFDYSISFINSNSDLANDSYLLFGITKNFELFSK
ncbi:MAG: TorF family putative porin [Pseudomonadota bacterium]|nr:TorF family putative porin [Pseudomonadota bacterium]